MGEATHQNFSLDRTATYMLLTVIDYVLFVFCLLALLVLFTMKIYYCFCFPSLITINY